MSDILLIDDDHRLAEMVGSYLLRAGFSVRHQGAAGAGLQALSQQVPELLILDLMLPDGDGLDVCRRVRQQSGVAGRVPILMLTARGDTTDRVVGLEIGADDYLPKPFEPRELLARVRALLRRRAVDRLEQESCPPPGVPGYAPGSPVQGTQAPASQTAHTYPPVLVLDDLQIDEGAREVRIAGERRVLTSYQFDLLLVLARHAGQVMSRDRLMTLVKGLPLEAFDRSIDVHVGKIRQAIEKDPRQPVRLLTVRGVGYVFARPRAVPA